MEKENVMTLVDAFKMFKDEKNIDRPVMMGVLKDVFLTQLAKTYGTADNFDVIVNVDKGTCEIYQNFEIVEEVEDPNSEMTLDQVVADSGDDDYEIGDTYSKVLPLAAFGRRGILNIRQNLQGRIMDIEKANVFKKYSEKVGELFSGEVYQTWSKEVLILDEDGNECKDLFVTTDKARGTLKELSADEKPIVTVYNKCDIAGSFLQPVSRNSVRISALNGTGIDNLLRCVADNLPDTTVRLLLKLPFSRADVPAKLRAVGTVYAEEYREDGIHVDTLIDKRYMKEYVEYIVKEF